MYVVRWEDQFPKMSHCTLVSVMKPGDEDEADDDGEGGGSDNGQLVDPPPPPARAPRRPPPSVPSLRTRAVVMMMSGAEEDEVENIRCNAGYNFLESGREGEGRQASRLEEGKN